MNSKVRVIIFLSLLILAAFFFWLYFGHPRMVIREAKSLTNMAEVESFCLKHKLKLDSFPDLAIPPTLSEDHLFHTLFWGHGSHFRIARLYYANCNFGWTINGLGKVEQSY